MRQIAVLFTCFNRKTKTLACLGVLYDCALPEGYIFDCARLGFIFPQERKRPSGGKPVHPMKGQNKPGHQYRSGKYQETEGRFKNFIVGCLLQFREVIGRYTNN